MTRYRGYSPRAYIPEGVRDMWEILRAESTRELIGSLLGMAAICVLLYALVIFSPGMQP